MRCAFRQLLQIFGSGFRRDLVVAALKRGIPVVDFEDLGADVLALDVVRQASNASQTGVRYPCRDQ